MLCALDPEYQGAGPRAVTRRSGWLSNRTVIICAGAGVVRRTSARVLIGMVTVDGTVLALGDAGEGLSHTNGAHVNVQRPTTSLFDIEVLCGSDPCPKTEFTRRRLSKLQVMVI